MTLGLLFGTLSAVEIQDVTTAIETSHLLRDTGRFVFRARPVPQVLDPQINRSDCDRLSRLNQVVAAGGLTETQAIGFQSAPGTPLRTFAGTGSVVRVLDSSATGDLNLIWLSVGARNTLGATETVRMTQGRISKASVFDPEERHPSASLMVVIPSLSPAVGECWFSTYPAASQATMRAVETLLSTDSLAVVAGSILEDSGVLVDPAADYSARSSRRLWIVVGLFGGLLLTISALADRGTMALHRLLGASRSQAILVGFVGATLAVVWSMLLAVGASAYWARNMPPEAIRNALLAVSGSAAIAILTSLVGRVVAALGSVGRQLRNRS